MKGNPRIHVVPNGGNGWNVKQEGRKDPLAHTDTQAEAAKLGTGIAKANETEFYLHGRNGQIREANSFGNDPCPPKDKR